MNVVQIYKGRCNVQVLHSYISGFLVSTAFAEKPLTEFFEKPAETTSAKPGDTAQGSSAMPDQPIAEINGETIDKQKFMDTLLACEGGKILRQMVLLAGARQLVQAEGLNVGIGEFDTEFERIVSELGPATDATGKKLTENDRRRILRLILRRRNISEEEFTMGLKRQAYLRAVARKQVDVTDEMVKAEFDRQYGPKRDVRIIVLDRLEVAQKVRSDLEKGADFGSLAKTYSIDLASASTGGRIGAVAANTTKLPAVVTETAFELAKNEISAVIMLNQQYWLVRVDEIIDAEPIKFEAVKNKLRQSVSDRLERQLMEKLQTQILVRSKIKVYNRMLAREFREWLDGQREE